MNDPGTKELVSDAAGQVEENLPFNKDDDPVKEMTFLKPSRWWLASTGSPLAAGTFGPVASFLSICALVQPWRVHVEGKNTDQQTTNISDPVWLIAVNSVSLAFAIIANVALLLNMAKKLSLSKAQPIIIVGWFLSGFLLIGLVAATSSKSTGFQLSPPDEHALTQAYFYAIYAAAIYCIIAIMMIVTFFSALTGRSAREYNLTTAQRTLMLQTISFLIYLLAGAAVYSKIEGWRYLDAIYWADFTLLTIGIGSPFTPMTTLGQALLFPFAIGGILTIGIVIGSVRSLVLDRGKEKLQARFLEKKREESIKSIDPDKSTIKVAWLKKYKFSKEELSEPQLREEEFLLMRKIEEEAAARERWMSLGISMLATLILWLVGAAILWIAERKGQGWTYFNALYFAYTSLLTIGYGDFSPKSSAGKSFFVIWTLMAIPCLTILISHMGDTIIKTFTDFVLWAGTITILPGDSKVVDHFKVMFRRLFKGAHINARELGSANQPPGFRPSGQKESKMSEESSSNEDVTDYETQLRNEIVDRFAKHIADDQMQAEKASNDPDAHDRHNYIYVLLRELVNVMAHLSADKPKKFSYRDWAWYLKLIGQDEDDEEIHSRPTQTLSNDYNEKDIGRAAGKENERLKWSWMGVRSPLMSKKTEAAWIAERLSKVLEHELDSMRTGRNSNRPVPITMRELAARLREQGDQSKPAQEITEKSYDGLTKKKKA